MSFSEESLEDKIAAIMRGNYNFGPPIQPPANLRVPVPVAVPSVTSSSSTSPVPDSAVADSLPRTSSGKKVQIEEPAPLAAGSVAESAVGKAKNGSEKDINELKRVQSVFVGYGDVYDDADDIEYDEQALHQDAVSDGYGNATGTDSASVSMSDVYYGANEPDGKEEDDEEEEEMVEEGSSKSALVSKPVERAAPPALAEDSPASRVQPQLDFIPLSARKTSPVPTAPVEDKDLSLDAERAAKTARQRDEQSHAEQNEPGHSGQASVAWRAPMQNAQISSIVKPVFDSSTVADVASPIDSKVQSLLFGEDSGAEDDASEHGQETLNFEPDEKTLTQESEPLDEDSLNGDELHDDTQESADLAQTIRTTLPLPAGSAGDMQAPGPVAAKPVPTIPAVVLSIPPARAPVSKPPKTPIATPTVPTAAQLQPRAKPSTHAAEAREQAAFLLPTIPEVVPTSAKPRAVTPQSVPKPSGPIKVATDKDDKHDHSKFLARISAATSVPIEAPPAPKPRPTTPTSIPHRPASSHPPKEEATFAAPTEEPAAAAPAPAAAVSRATPKKVVAEPVPTVINISPPRGRAVAEPPVLSSSKRTTSPASIRKAPAVLMSTTSADEIAAASAGAAAHNANTKTPTRTKSPARATPAKATPAQAAPAAPAATSTSMKESALLGNNNSNNSGTVQGIKIPSLKKDATTPGKVKTPAWVVESAVTPPKSVPRPSAASESAAKPEKTVPVVKPPLEKPPVQKPPIEKPVVAKPVAENPPVSTPAQASKPPVRAKTPEPAPRPTTPSFSYPDPATRYTPTPSAVKFAEEDFDSGAAARAAAQKARAASPNTIARSASRIPQPNAGLTEDAPHNERAVKVAVRVRPFTPAELQHGQRRTISMNDGRLVIVNPKSFEDEPDAVAAVAVATDNRQWANLFEFDNILWNFDPKTKEETLVDQIELHRSLGLEIVENALNGVSSSCFAYGHTCTGKTYSLFGSDEADKEAQKRDLPTRLPKFSLSSESGLIQRIFHDIIRLSHKNTRVFLSFMEIYNEKIRDLLVERPASHHHHSDTHSQNGSTNGKLLHGPNHLTPAVDTLKLREHPTFGPYVESLTKVEIFSVQDALRLIAKGQLSRTSAQTVWNANSSRSHAVVTLELTPTEIDPSKHYVDPAAKEVYEASQSPFTSPSKVKETVGEGYDIHHLLQYTAPLLQQVVRVQMVDLAGSEKDTIKDEEDHAMWAGGRYHDSTPNKHLESLADKEKNELRLIRRSLSTLGFIIKALTKGATMRSLPYRDCTLTFLLRDALCGRNHTTMLATISPAHSCYEETLSTLRYAERLCEVHTNRKIAARVAGKDVSADLIASLDENTLGPRRAILAEFQRVHQRQRANNKSTNSLNSREIFRQTLSDPQQRIARLQNASHGEALRPHTHATPVKNFSINGFSKPLSEVTDEDLEQLKNSYRQLTSDVIEMQIDLDAVRTDRDTLMVELKGATDALTALENNKDDARNQVQSLSKYLRAAEKELGDLHALLKKRDESIEKLLVQVAEERAARNSSEQALQTRTKEFMARIEAMKKESKVLAGSLETVSDKHKATADEKKDQQALIERLKAQVKTLTAQRDANAAQIADVKSQHDHVGKKFEAASVKVGRLEDLEREVTTMSLQAEKTKADLAVLASEKDSLVALLAQKDTMMQVQAQQAERTNRMLQLKINNLERAASFSAALTGAPPVSTPGTKHLEEDYSQLQGRLSSLLSSEGQILRSELVDTHKLTAIIKEMCVKLQELEDKSQELVLERAAREDLQKRLNQQSLSTQVEHASKAALDHQVTVLQMELHKLQEMHKKALQEHKIQSEVNAGSKASLEEQVSTLQKELLTTKDELALTKTRLAQQADLVTKASATNSEYVKLQAENAAIKDQLILTQKDALTAREELKATQETMQTEYAGMWSSVQELSKLDALKDQSIQDLIMDRDKAVFERDAALERFAAAKTESAQLMQDLQELDTELLHAVEAGEYRLSPRGQHKSIVLHNVSDRLMFSLSRRQQQHAQVQQQAAQLGFSSLNNTLSSTSHSGNGLFASPQPSHPSQHQVNLNYTNNSFQGLLSPTFQSPHSALPASAANTPVLVYPTITAQAARPPPQQQQQPQAVSNAPAGGGILKNANTKGQAQGSAVAPKARSPKNQQVQGQAQQNQFQRSNSASQQSFHQGQQQSQYAPSAGQSHSQSQGQGQYPGQGQTQGSFYQQPATQTYTPMADAHAQYRAPVHQQQQQQQLQTPQYAKPAQQGQQPSYPQQNISQHQRQSEVPQQYRAENLHQQQQRYSVSEEKEYSRDEEMLEKELEELSVMEDEARSKRQRMKNGSSGTLHSMASNASMTSQLSQSQSNQLRSSFASRSNF